MGNGFNAVMAQISFQQVAHSYLEKPSQDEDWAIRELTHEWTSGAAYALLGPSGCGKTTMLNIVSGLLTPTTGKIFIDEQDVTKAPPEKRNIAQVFQFPVVYDTMTTRQNLAFPLVNQGLDHATINSRIKKVAAILELEDELERKAANLGAESKQKISFGRGLVRNDVAAILFDEPLTVIDPQIKWRLRSNLKRLHQEFNYTMIYVTHDQTEALTFADKILVMHAGQVVQAGTPQELFEKPRHTFVGHFIGSPGMNIFDCEVKLDKVYVAGTEIPTDNALPKPGVATKLGVRPEHVRFSPEGLPAQVTLVRDLGHQLLVELEALDAKLKMVLPQGTQIPTEAKITFDPDYSYVYADDFLVDNK